MLHLCVSILLKISVSNFMGYLKGKSTLMIYDRHPEQQSKWNKAFRARGYYVATAGNVTEDGTFREMESKGNNEKAGTVWLTLKALEKPIDGRIKQGREIGDEIVYH